MISCISPCHTSTDDTLNTLKYTERLKCSTNYKHQVNIAEKYTIKN